MDSRPVALIIGSLIPPSFEIFLPLSYLSSIFSLLLLIMASHHPCASWPRHWHFLLVCRRRSFSLSSSASSHAG